MGGIQKAHFSEIKSLLASSSGSQRLKLLSTLKGQVTHGLRLVAHTRLACRTHLAVRPTKLNQDVGLATSSDMWLSLLTALTLPTDHDLVVPVNREVLQAKAGAFGGVPVGIRAYRTQ